MPCRFLGASSLSLALIAGFAMNGCPGPAASAQNCAGDARPQLDCESEFQYDGSRTGGKLGFAGLSSEVQTEKKALRQIDTETQQYIVQARRLCDEYNKCVLDRAAYAERSENLRRRLAKLPDLYDSIRNAGTEAARAGALSNAYQQVVPAGDRIELSLEFSVVAQRPGDGSFTPIPPGASLSTGSRVSFSVQASRDAYVYLFQRSPQGSVVTLFPDARIGVTNPIAAGRRVEIPGGGVSFRLNDKDLGTESVFVVGSLAPLASLESSVGRLAQGSNHDPTLDRLSTALPDTPESAKCRSRALELDSNTTCVRSRGLELDSSGPATAPDASLRAKTEAADTVIAKVFSFEHTGG